MAIPGEWYLDSDSDGVGGESVTTMCHPPTGYVAGTGDCDDTTADVFPGAPEVCDSVDNDCNELIDDDDPNLDRTELAVMYRDADGDGVGVEDRALPRSATTASTTTATAPRTTASCRLPSP